MTKPRISILTNIPTTYKSSLFTVLNDCKEIDFKFFYLAETEKIREWKLDRKFQFSYEIMFKGQLDKINPLRLAFKTWFRFTQFKPDIVIIDGYSYLACWSAFLWAKINRKSIILWSASNEADRIRKKLKEAIKRVFISRCNAANVYGTSGTDYLAKLGIDQEKIFIMGNVTDNNFYYNKTKEIRQNKTEICDRLGIPHKNFLFIGRLSTEKNILFLLDAFKKVEGNSTNNWGLILVGSGPLEEEIKDFIRHHSLKDVLLTGFKQKDEIPVYLAASDVLILPSTSEPWGIVVNEAMAAGLPVIVSKKCGCYPDLIKEGKNGFSFDPNNSEEIIKLMKEITDDKHDLLKMGDISLKIISKYTPEESAKTVIRTIDFVNSVK